MTNPLTETAKEAARRLATSAIAQGFQPEKLHEYRGADGKPLYWRIRAKRADGEKWIRPMYKNGHGFELGEPKFAGGKPLYNLDRICANAKASVWICEGEKACEALTELGAIATTSGGAQSVSTADWTPLRGRECRLWPDNDDAGKGYAGEVGSILAGMDCGLSCVDIAKLALPPKGDAADWVQTRQNLTLRDLDTLPRLTYQPLQKAAPGSDSSGFATLELLSCADVVPESVTWLWHGWLAAGKLHILAGAPGTGKTTIALALAAILSAGGRWPDGSPATSGEVLIWSGEDDLGDTLVPRLLAMGADTSRIHFVGAMKDGGRRRPFDPATDMDALRLEVARLGNVRLLIVDPVVSAVAADSHKNTEVRRALQPLVDLGVDCGCAVLGISHFSKGTAGRDPVERVTGSIAFGAVARIVLAAARLPDEGDKKGGRLLARAKSNIGPDTGGFGYDLEQMELDSHPGIYASRVLWGAAIDGTARELLAQADANDDPEEQGAMADAKKFLKETLTEGALSSKQILAEARDAGHSDRTIKRAKKDLGVEAFKPDMKTGWKWRLPAKEAKNYEEGQQNKLAPFAESGPLRRAEGSSSTSGDDAEVFA